MNANHRGGSRDSLQRQRASNISGIPVAAVTAITTTRAAGLADDIIDPDTSRRDPADYTFLMPIPLTVSSTDGQEGRIRPRTSERSTPGDPAAYWRARELDERRVPKTKEARWHSARSDSAHQFNLGHHFRSRS